MAIVVLPRSLTVLFPGVERRVEADGATVAELIDALDRRWPGVRDRLCQRSDALREFINVYVDGQPADLATPVGPAGTSISCRPWREASGIGVGPGAPARSALLRHMNVHDELTGRLDVCVLPMQQTDDKDGQLAALQLRMK